MASELLSFTYLTATTVGVVLLGLAGLATWSYWKKPKKYTLRSEYFRAPANSTLTVLGLLLPAATAAAGYLYATDLSTRLGFLLASITLLVVALFAAIWVEFALIAKGGGNETITLDMPDDRSFVLPLAGMYGGLLLGISCLLLFFLFGLPQSPPGAADDGRGSGAGRLLSRPHIAIGNQCHDVRRLWGEPISADAATGQLTYEGPSSVITVECDAQGELTVVTEKRRSP